MINLFLWFPAPPMISRSCTEWLIVKNHPFSCLNFCWFLWHFETFTDEHLIQRSPHLALYPIDLFWPSIHFSSLFSFLFSLQLFGTIFRPGLSSQRHSSPGINWRLGLRGKGYVSLAHSIQISDLTAKIKFNVET